MCGITGWLDWQQNMLEKALIIEQMSDALTARGPDGSGVWLSPRCAFGHRRLSVIDPANGAQPMVFRQGERTYVITYNGELYNAGELRRELENLGHRFQTNCDTEVLLHACIEWGKQALPKLNGIFAFAYWDDGEQKAWIARDRLGVKPLFYAELTDGLVFASELKALLLHPAIKAEVSADGMAEIWGLGPARTPGHGIFRQIKELRPGRWLEFSRQGVREGSYWDLQYSEHTDDEATTIAHVGALLQAAARKQLIADVPLCMFLSGGLDSSALTALAAASKAGSIEERLRTCSVDYEEQARFFSAHAFQPDSDAAYIAKMRDFLNTEHHMIELSNERLFEALSDAVHARDLPGMADIDASLMLFCREIKKIATVAISGEAADEIFGGYPWFRTSIAELSTFPWAPAVDFRERILSTEARERLQLKAYVARRYSEALAEVPVPHPHGSNDSAEDTRMRALTYLNITRFMPVLLERKDRMSMACGLEVRVPFCDHELVEYVFNIPWSLKQHGGREKGLLRAALKGVLPDDVLWRKKSPYPKTHHPLYTTLVKQATLEMLADRNAPILPWIDTAVVRQFAASEDVSSHSPWFGQLMSGPQFLAYLLQMNTWLRDYKVSFV